MISRQRVARTAVATGLILLLWTAVVLVLARWHAPGVPEAQSDPLVAAADLWKLTIGAGRAEADGLSIDSLNAVGEAFLVWQPKPFDAAVKPVLSLRIDEFPLNHVLMLAWRRAGAPAADFNRLQVPRGGTDTYLMSRHPAWSGKIVEVALYLYPQAQTSPPLPLTRPMVLRELRLEPDGWGARVGALATGWLAADPWALMSVSSLGVYRDLDEGFRLTPLLFIAFLIGAAVSGFVFARRNARAWGRLMIGWLAAAVLIAHAHWLVGLAAQRAASNQVYAGLSEAEKAQRLFDRDLVRLAAEAKRRLPEPPQARVFVAADARFFRLRAAWHLRPHNVLSALPGEDIGPVKWIRPGDYLFFHRRPDLLAQAQAGSLGLKRRRWQVELLFGAEGSGLLEFVAGQP